MLIYNLGIVSSSHHFYDTQHQEMIIVTVIYPDSDSKLWIIVTCGIDPLEMEEISWAAPD
ncbi:hypothetical protein TrispH2_009065 [Trichoplax sp. H2]|nr:hypothetical protein TrispH2_009065 [Trichoplax sp. H2]|eukprot:RDD38523.1 hypothetical protein TrispH2_009065 [Trichoplax sp. H2]